MATLQRAIGARAINHADADSDVHKEDVAENNRRRGLYWLAIQEAIEDQHRVIPGLGSGLYVVRDHPLFGAYQEIQEGLASDLADITATYGLKRAEGGVDLEALKDREKRAIQEAKLRRREEFEALHSAEDSGNMLLVDGKEMVVRLNCWAADLSYYRRWIKDPKCTKGYRWKRTAKEGIQGHVVSAAAWLSNLVYEAAEQGNHEKVKEMALKATGELARAYEERTKRRVVSVQCHFDTTSMHFHLFTSRIGRDHKFIKGTSDKFGLIGPWACGVLRQGENESAPGPPAGSWY